VTDAARFDRAYFDRWYRDPRHRVHSPGERARRVALVVAATEAVLGRPLRRVLDVGAGEGHWQPILARLRPRARYRGLDPSAYAVARFGARRGIRLGGFDDLRAAGRRPYDLVVCSGFLNYLPAPRLRAGLSALRALIGGVAYLELFTAADELSGDHATMDRRSAATYRRWLGTAGLVPLGLHCWAPRAVATGLAELERAGA
jgi:SAM-dependent methyltransferase